MSRRSKTAECPRKICAPALWLAVSVAVVGCQSTDKPSAPAPSAATPISGSLLTVEASPWPVVARVQGSLLADEVSTIAARVVGRIVEVDCDLGDSVAAGSVLVRLDDTEYKLKVIQAEAQLAQVRAAIGLKSGDPVSKLNPLNAPPVRETKALLDEAGQQVTRLKRLFDQGAIVATDFEAAQSAEQVADARYNSSLNSVREKMALVDVQAAQLQLAEQQLSDTVVLAPLDGVVLNRSVAVGTYVQAGQPIVELAKISPLRFRASVPERFARQLRIGQQVLLKFSGEERQSKVARISPALDPASRSLVFEASVLNEDSALRSGLFGQAEVTLDEHSTAITVPSSALVRFAGVDKVWRVADGEVSEAVVQVGRESDGLIEITEGLNSGDSILQIGASGRTGTYSEDPPSASKKADLVTSTVVSANASLPTQTK